MTASDVTLEWRRFDELPAALLYEVLRFRQAIFVVEQGSAYEDLDGRDEAALHLLARRDGALVGYLRLIPEPERTRIGRVSVAADYRGQGFARRMMAAALAERPGLPAAISAQSYLVPFYASLGFTPTSREYDDAGVPHVDMVRLASTDCWSRDGI